MDRNILHNMYLLAAMQGLFLMIILFLDKKIKKHKIVLPFFITFITLRHFAAYIEIYNKSASDIIYIFSTVFFYFLGPLTLLYIYYISGKLKRKNLFLLISPLPLLIPYLIDVFCGQKNFALFIFSFVSIEIMTVIYLFISFIMLTRHYRYL